VLKSGKKDGYRYGFNRVLKHLVFRAGAAALQILPLRDASTEMGNHIPPDSGSKVVARTRAFIG